MNHPPIPPVTVSSHSQPQHAEDEVNSKQQLAEEINRIEEDLERKRLEDEIKRMEDMIAAHSNKEGTTTKQRTASLDTSSASLGAESYLSEGGDEGDISAYETSDYYTDDDGEYVVEEFLLGDDDDSYYEEEVIEDGDEDMYEEEVYEEEEELAAQENPNNSVSDMDEGYEDFGGHESFMVKGGPDFNSSVLFDLNGSQSISVPQSPAKPAGKSLLGDIAFAATARSERLDEDGAELKMKDHTPTTPAPVRPMDTFDLTAMVSQKARERTDRLEAGGEKKMTEIKTKSEYKLDFNNVALEAAELGRLTRLNEHCIESVAVEKTAEEEWRSKGLLAIDWRTQHMSIIHEAARAGAASKLPEKVVSNFSDEEEDNEYSEYDENRANQKRVSARMKQLLDMSSKVGGGNNKVETLLLERKEEKEMRGHDSLVRSMRYYQEGGDLSAVKLPRRKPPKIDPAKELDKIQAKFKGTYRQDRPLSNISNEVAERAWARRTRLDRPGSMPRVQEICNCPYCLDPSPYQTHAYKEKDKERKAAGYVSPDSEEERQKAREKRRQERRKNRPQRSRGERSAVASSSSGGMKAAAEKMGGAPTTATETGSSSRRSRGSHRLSTSTAAEGSATAENEPPRRGGKIRAQARRMSMTGTLPPANDEPLSPPPPAPAATPPAAPPKKTTKRVSRRRRPNGEAAAEQAPRPSSTSSNAASEKPMSKPRRSGRHRSSTKSAPADANKKTAIPDGPKVTEQIIRKSDGTRVVRKVTSAAPKKVVTKKVITRSAKGKKKVQTTKTVVDDDSAPTPAAPPPPPAPAAPVVSATPDIRDRSVSRTTSQSSASVASNNRAVSRTISNSSGASNDRVVTRTISSNSGASNNSRVISRSVSATRGTQPSRAQSSRAAARSVSAARAAPASRSVSRSVSTSSGSTGPPPPPPSASPRVTVTKEESGRVVTTTTTTTTRKPGTTPRRSMFSRKKPQMSEI